MLAHTRIAGTQSGGGHSGSREGAEGVVQARQPENIERRWVLAAAGRPVKRAPGKGYGWRKPNFTLQMGIVCIRDGVWG